MPNRPNRDLANPSICDALNDFSAEAEKGSSLDVAVVPEIAAQIYGFVVSNSFDKKAANNYLMVDVGAGTVDSSLFHVKPGRGGKWDFEFYTAAVEPLGVTNLHRSSSAKKQPSAVEHETRTDTTEYEEDHRHRLLHARSRRGRSGGGEDQGREEEAHA